jgi:hypothetical protein
MPAGKKTPATQDAVIRKATAALVTRSERAEDVEHLVATFVDCGIIDMIDNSKNQILYGRRGTGKTHVLRYLGSRFREQNFVVVYIDARTLGSSTIYSDMERPLHTRFIGLYRDVLSLLHNALLEDLVVGEHVHNDRAFNALAEVERQINYAEDEGTQIRERVTEGNSGELAGGVRASISAAGPSLTAKVGGATRDSREREVETRAASRPKVIFPAVYEAFNKTLELMGIERLVILLDEWSSIPNDLQPYLAELLNRAFFANPKVSIKIATLEFRSRFAIYDPKGHRIAGLELGGDIETALDLDDFYVYDRNPENTEATFADLLLKHLGAAFDDLAYLEREYGVSTPDDFVDLMFTDKAFKELVRAAEGVARDLLQIFTRAYLNAWKSGAAHITVPTVTNAAREWYEKDKQSNLGENQHALLKALVDNVIGDRHARSFLVAREDSSAPVLRSLIDQRVVHIIRNGYADKDNPGTRYNIYTLDYGCYVDLKGTKGEPEFEISDEEAVVEAKAAGSAPVVPFDDNRRIRRIVVPRELLLHPARWRDKQAAER